MIVKLLTEHYFEFLSLKGGCRGSSVSTLVKMPHCWKSHVVSQMSLYATGSRADVKLFHYLLCKSTYGPRHEKPVFGVSDKVRFKPVCSATETS